MKLAQLASISLPGCLLPCNLPVRHDPVILQCGWPQGHTSTLADTCEGTVYHIDKVKHSGNLACQKVICRHKTLADRAACCTATCLSGMTL